MVGSVLIKGRATRKNACAQLNKRAWSRAEKFMDKRQKPNKLWDTYRWWSVQDAEVQHVWQKHYMFTNEKAISQGICYYVVLARGGQESLNRGISWKQHWHFGLCLHEGRRRNCKLFTGECRLTAPRARLYLCVWMYVYNAILWVFLWWVDSSLIETKSSQCAHIKKENTAEKKNQLKSQHRS